MFVNHKMHHKRIDTSCMLSCNDPKQSYKSYDPKQLYKSYSSPFIEYVVHFSINSRHCFNPPTNPYTFILAIVSIHLQLLLYITHHT